MVNSNKLKGRIVEKGMKQGTIAESMELTVSTLNRKINDTTGQALTVREANVLREMLDIENPTDYFFC